MTDAAPRIVALPLTSSVVAGAVVPIPILAVAPLPVWPMAEFSISVAVLQRGMRFTVPPEVVTSEETEGELVLEPAIEGEALEGAANTNAEGGSPPIVSASAAFKA